jgi:hypothetical protein
VDRTARSGITSFEVQLQPGFVVHTLDVSPDGKQIVFDPVPDNPDIVLIDLK